MERSPPDRWPPRATVFTVAALLLLPLVLLGEALLPGAVLADWGTALVQPWMADATVLEQSRPLVNADTVRENLPYRIFLDSSLTRGEIPWWNPYSFCGLPFVGLSHTQVLYPPSWAATLLDPYQGYTALIVFHLWVAGLGMLAWLRASGLSLPAAAFGAVVFTLNGMFATRHGHPQFVATACWLPWTLLGIEWLLQRRHGAGTALVGLATAMAILAGHPSIYVYGYYFVGAWLLARALWLADDRSPRVRAVAIALFTVGFLLGVALASTQLLAVLELGDFSARQERGVDVLVRRLTHWTHLFRIPFWGALGSPVDGTYWSPTFTSFTAGTLYVGVVPLLLGCLGFFRGGRSGKVLGGLIAAGILVLFVPFVFRFAYTLPGFQFGRVDRLSIGLFLFGAHLAALGAQSLLETRPGVAPAWRDAAVWLGGGALASLAALVVLPLAAEGLTNRYGDGEFSVPAMHTAVAWGMLLWLGAAAVLWSAHSGISRRGLLGAALVLTLVDLGLFWRHFVVIRDADRLFRETPATEFLQRDADPFRIAKLGGRKGPDDWLLMPANIPMVFEIEDVHGFGPLHPKTLDTLLAAADGERGENAWHVMPLSTPEAIDSPILDVLQVRYLLSHHPVEDPGWRLVHDGDLLIYENLSAFPRALFVPGWNKAGTDRKAARALASGEVDPRQTVLIAGDGPRRVPQAPTPSGDNDVQLTARGLNQVGLRKTGPDAGWVLLLDTWYPGWTATVDGEPVTIERADVHFRAIQVPAGDHEIAFSYQPTYLPKARWFTGLGALGLLVSLGFAGRELRSATRRSNP